MRQPVTYSTPQHTLRFTQIYAQAAPVCIVKHAQASKGLHLPSKNKLLTKSSSALNNTLTLKVLLSPPYKDSWGSAVAWGLWWHWETQLHIWHLWNEHRERGRHVRYWRNNGGAQINRLSVSSTQINPWWLDERNKTRSITNVLFCRLEVRGCDIVLINRDSCMHMLPDNQKTHTKCSHILLYLGQWSLQRET